MGARRVGEILAEFLSHLQSPERPGGVRGFGCLGEVSQLCCVWLRAYVPKNVPTLRLSHRCNSSEALYLVSSYRPGTVADAGPVAVAGRFQYQGRYLG